MRELTKRDKEILEYIKFYMMTYGTTPTLREIGEAVNLYSTSSVHNHFQRLVNAGYIIQMADGKTYRYKVRGMKYIYDET